MENSYPLVSIILPVNNQAPFLQETLQSILDQKYENFEVIAIDDNSKDESFKILREFRKKDKRIRVYKNINKYGLKITLNRALSKARGEFIAFMPKNGKNYLGRIQKQVNFLAENENIAAAGSQVTYISSKGKIISKSNFPIDHEKIEGNLLNPSSFNFESFLIAVKRLPKDLLRFEQEAPLIYSTLLIKMSKYVKIANLEESLVYERIEAGLMDYQIFIKKLIEKFRINIYAYLFHEYKPSLRSLFTL